MKKIWYGVIGVAILLTLISMILPNNLSKNQNNNVNTYKNLNETKFNQLAIQALYDHGFCYQGMLDEEGKECGEAEYPFIRVYNAEDFTEHGKILLVTKVTEDLYSKFPSLSDKTLTYVFRNTNQESVDTIYVKENKWNR